MVVTGVKRSPASVILSVYPHDKTKTAETKIAKLGTEIVHHNTSTTNEYWIKRSKVKVTGSKSAKSRNETAVRRRLFAM